MDSEEYKKNGKLTNWKMVLNKIKQLKKGKA
jgi:hypothetical protein